MSVTLEAPNGPEPVIVASAASSLTDAMSSKSEDSSSKAVGLARALPKMSTI